MDLIIIALIAIAGYANGTMDWIKFKSLDSESWKNKWCFDEFGEGVYPYNYWYYFGLYKPKYQEKFIYSSTILVFLTDQWHLKKWCMFLCYEVALSSVIVYYEVMPWWCILIGIAILKTFRGLGFTLKYDKK